MGSRAVRTSPCLSQRRAPDAPSQQPEPLGGFNAQRPVRWLPGAVTIFSSSAFHLDQCLSFFLPILTFSTVLLLLCLCGKEVGAQNLQTGWGV